MPTRHEPASPTEAVITAEDVDLAERRVAEARERAAHAGLSAAQRPTDPLTSTSAEKIPVLLDVLPDGLRGVASDVLNGHGGDVLLHVGRQSYLAELVQPFVVGRLNRGDGSAQGLGVLVGDLVDVKRCRAGQFVDRAEVVLWSGQHRGDDVGDVTGRDGRSAAASERQ